MSKLFQVGVANDPQAGDAFYESESEAIAIAEARAGDAPFEEGIAVWDNETCDIVHLFFRGQHFVPVPVEVGELSDAPMSSLSENADDYL